MALIKCRTCGGAVSSEAEPPCPHCKDPYITEERKQQTEERKRQTEKREWEDKIRRGRIDKGLCSECGSRMKEKGIGFS